MEIRRGPTTHVGMLATVHHLPIQYVNPHELQDALDWSTDLHPGQTMADFDGLLHLKEANCTEWFNNDLATRGIQEPLIVIIRSDGRWQMDEGHHRLTFAKRYNLDVPVIFDDTGADDDSIMGYVVSRSDVEAYHDTTLEDVVVVAATQQLFDETDQFLALTADAIEREELHRAAMRSTERRRGQLPPVPAMEIPIIKPIVRGRHRADRHSRRD